MMMEDSKSSRGIKESNQGVEFGECEDLGEDDYIDWADGEIGSTGAGDQEQDKRAQWNGEVTIEEGTSEAKPATRQQRKRKITAKDKEFAEIVHKAHILCLIGRGRLVEAACDDPLLQASVLSVAPVSLSVSAQSGASKRKILGDLVSWFKTSFRVSNGDGSSSQERENQEISRQLQESIQKQSGSAEEITAVAVALLRALGFTTRYVAVLNVASLKPDAESLDASQEWDPDSNEQAFNFSPMDDMESKRVASLAQILASTVPQTVVSSGHKSKRLPSHEASSPSTSVAASASPKGRGRGGRMGRGGRLGRGGRGGRSRGKSGGGSTVNSPTGGIGMLESKPAISPRGTGVDNAASSSSSHGDPRNEVGGLNETRQKREDDIQHEKELALAISLSAAESESKPTGSKRSLNDEFERGMAMAIAASAAGAAASEADSKAVGQKRKGDEEYERELAIAMAATAGIALGKGIQASESVDGVTAQSTPPTQAAMASKRIKGLGMNGSSAISSADRKGREYGGAAWSRKFGPIMHWAEVYFDRETQDGRWMHVDAARGIVDGADKVEAAAAGHLPLRYAVAFAGGGAKDVTRRYVKLWSTVSPLRVDANWWDETLAPLKELEAAATAGPPSSMRRGEETSGVPAQRTTGQAVDMPIPSATTDLSNVHKDVPVAEPNTSGTTAVHDTNKKSPAVRTRASPSMPALQRDRSALEDMEMETKAFTEPLPTNQQAYRSHHLYALERWLNKYEILHPKGPVIGFCGGQPVYPRTCVQVLHTPDRWLREGFKVKSGESAAKVVRASRFAGKKPSETTGSKEDGKGDECSGATLTELYGKWQTEAWQPPRAVNGKVPKDERGQVDARSKHCIPPGTVHLCFARLVPVAQKLGIDFAPAMVGFEIRKGRSFPVYEGIVVCEEFKDVIMDAFAHEEDVRLRLVLKKKRELAGKRWVSFIRSMSTRHRLQVAYENASSPKGSKKRGSGVTSPAVPSRSSSEAKVGHFSGSQPPQKKRSTRSGQILDSEHVHSFPEENQSFDEETGVRTKKCDCGFTYYVEDM